MRRTLSLMEILTDDQLRPALNALRGWGGTTSTITRTQECASFPQAVFVVSAIAAVAERMNHHPDIDIRWRTLTFTLSTHSAGGVTAADVELAQQIDAVLAQLVG